MHNKPSASPENHAPSSAINALAVLVLGTLSLSVVASPPPTLPGSNWTVGSRTNQQVVPCGGVNTPCLNLSYVHAYVCETPTLQHHYMYSTAGLPPGATSWYWVTDAAEVTNVLSSVAMAYRSSATVPTCTESVSTLGSYSVTGAMVESKYTATASFPSPGPTCSVYAPSPQDLGTHSLAALTAGIVAPIAIKVQCDQDTEVALTLGNGNGSERVIFDGGLVGDLALMGERHAANPLNVHLSAGAPADPIGTVTISDNGVATHAGPQSSSAVFVLTVL